jgi:hypothetical protein
MAYSSTRQSFLTGARPVRGYRRPTPDARKAFPELEPADTGGEPVPGHLARIRTDLAAQFRDIRDNPETDNALSRLTVYALNAMLLILAFPVGFAMLMFNLLMGENLRITIHVLALTGLALTLSRTETAARVLGLG